MPLIEQRERDPRLGARQPVAVLGDLHAELVRRELELELADIQHLENLLPKAERAAKGADKDAKNIVRVFRFLTVLCWGACIVLFSYSSPPIGGEEFE